MKTERSDESIPELKITMGYAVLGEQRSEILWKRNLWKISYPLSTDRGYLYNIFPSSFPFRHLPPSSSNHLPQHPFFHHPDRRTVVLPERRVEPIRYEMTSLLSSSSSSSLYYNINGGEWEDELRRWSVRPSA